MDSYILHSVSFTFLFSVFYSLYFRGHALTLPSVPSPWPATCPRTGTLSSTVSGILWYRHPLSTLSWLWSLWTPSSWWWRWGKRQRWCFLVGADLATSVTGSAVIYVCLLAPERNMPLSTWPCLPIGKTHLVLPLSSTVCHERAAVDTLVLK